MWFIWAVAWFSKVLNPVEPQTATLLRYRWLDHEVELFGLSCKMWDEDEVLAYPHPQDALTAMAAGTQTEVCVNCLALPVALLYLQCRKVDRLCALSAAGSRNPRHDE